MYECMDDNLFVCIYVCYARVTACTFTTWKHFLFVCACAYMRVCLTPGTSQWSVKSTRMDLKKLRLLNRKTEKLFTS